MKSRKTLAFLLVLVMVLSLALTACGGGDTSGGGNNSSSGSNSSSNNSSSDSNSSSGSGSDQTAFKVATVRWADWGELYHTGVPDQAAAETGISIEWQTILNADWGDRKAVTLTNASQLPDAFLGNICIGESDVVI